MNPARSRAAFFIVLVALVTTVGAAVREREDRFNHPKHARLFPLCTSCHLGALEGGQALWPSPRSCQACHDGRTESVVDWTPRTGPRPGNLRFVHATHADEASRARPGDSLLAETCSACHAEAGAPRMAVAHTVVGRCLDCHQLAPAHLEVADSACGTCHFPLAEAPSLTASAVAAFPAPASHERPGYEFEEHGRAARVPGTGPGTFLVAASCATCHARDFCITCHVDAPEEPVIQALLADPRSTAIRTELPEPPSHRRATFEREHGRSSRSGKAGCATCHTRESCTVCHVGVTPEPAGRFASAGPGRGPGAQITRAAPTSHTWEFRDRHAAAAAAKGASCQSCHVREDCLSCHRPGPTSERAYHPDGFLTRHPASAYNRDASCADCHNAGQFCQSCHQQSGLVAGSRRLGVTGYHDANSGFSLGHGQAARQALESCASCHTERDCTTCHSSVGGGLRFSPHGPGWNPERVKQKNPSVCVACHGRNIPG